MSPSRATGVAADVRSLRCRPGRIRRAEPSRDVARAGLRWRIAGRPAFGAGAAGARRWGASRPSVDSTPATDTASPSHGVGACVAFDRAHRRGVGRRDSGSRRSAARISSIVIARSPGRLVDDVEQGRLARTRSANAGGRTRRG